jgi:putative nucleotidyltransferase-like protein
LAAAAELSPAKFDFLIREPGFCSTDPEFEFLLACCKAEHNKSDLAEIPESPLNWKRVLQLANRHRVLPALSAMLDYASSVPDEIRSAFLAERQKHTLRSLRFCAELRGILLKLDGDGIEALAHKGPMLAQRLFGDAAMRQFGDLDFLIRSKDIPRARAALQELGYRASLQLSPRQEKAYRRAGYEYVFGAVADKHLIELQWQVLPRFYSVDFDMESLFSCSVEIDFDGQRARVLGNEDLMLVLCVHAAKHEWEHLGMIRDIAALARRDLNWQWIQSEARRLGIFRLFLVSLLLARNLLQSDLPLRFASEKEMSRCGKLVRAFELKLRSGTQTNPGSLNYFASMIQLRERRRDRLRFAWRLAVTPNLGEWESIALPDRLFPLYRAVRATRLMRRFCRL